MLRQCRYKNIVSSLRYLSAESAQRQRVVIPPAIERDSTDLLRALSDTILVDHTAPHFAFIDDPTTIPTTATNKRNYYMAKELGKRAARQLAEEWPTLFAFDRDQPRLSVFRPVKTADPLLVNPTEDNLIAMINSKEVEDSVRLYERMRSDDVNVSNETQMELFKLVCYYNGSNVPFSEWPEWHGTRNYGENKSMPWNIAGIADLLFETIPRTAETESIMIAALHKYPSSKSIERANDIFKEMKSAKRIPSREAYDAMISFGGDKLQEILKIMKKDGVMPTEHTLNAAITAIGKARKMGDAERLSALQSLMGEGIQLGLLPNLTTYHLILNQLNDDREDNKKPSTLKQSITWLSEIMNELKEKNIQRFSSSDHLFFIDAISIASKCANIEMADDIVALYESKFNSVKMPSFTIEGQFYSIYLNLSIEVNSSIELIESKYRSLVPRVVGVNRQLIMTLCDKLKIIPHWSLLHRIIEDSIASRMMTDMRVSALIRQRLLNISYQDLSVVEREEYSNLIKRMVDIWLEFSRFTEERQKHLQHKMTSSSICESALLLHRIGETDRAYQLLQLLLDPTATNTINLAGYARPGVISELFEDAIRQSDGVRAAICIEIMSWNLSRQQLEPLAQRIIDRCSLSSDQQSIIKSFVRLRPE